MNISLTRSTTRRSGALATAATLALLMSGTSAFALEGKALFDKVMATSKATITYETIEEDGASFVMRGVTVTSSTGEPGSADEFAFTNLREEGEAIVFDSATLTNMKSRANNENTTTASSFTFSNVSFPAKLAEGNVEAAKSGRVRIGSATITDMATDEGSDGTVDMSIASIEITGLNTPLDWNYTPEALSGAGSGGGGATAQDAAGAQEGEPFTLGSFAMKDLKFSQDGTGVNLGTFSVNGVSLPTTLAAPIQDFAKVYDTIAMNGLEMSAGGKRFFAWDELSARILPSEGGAIRSESKLVNFFADLAAAPNADPAALKALTDLGYAQMTGNMTGNGSYDVESGRIAIDKLELAIDRLAALDISYVMTGYTPEVARQISAISAQAGQGGGNGNPMAVLGLLGQLKLESVSFSLKDDSGTKKLLDYFAAQQGTTGDQLAAGVPFLISAGMQQLNMPEFTQSVSTAVGNFLQNPGTLTISAKPSQAVPLFQAFITGQQSPKAAVEMMNVQVEATN